jgi:hypothetical protein
MMRLFTGSRRGDALALDEDTAERLLSGRCGPADAPPAYGCVAELLAAAAAQPSIDELAGQAAAFRELRGMLRVPPPAVLPRRAARSRTRLHARVAIAVVVGAMSVSAIAGASGLGEPIGRAARSALAAVGVGGPAAPAGVQDTNNAPPTSPVVEQAALEGLCRAYLAGQVGQHGGKTDAAALRALATAAGDADKIAAYCQAPTAESPRGRLRGGPGTTPGLDGTSPALRGLCRAYLAGQGGQHGDKHDAAAFRALAMVAGGADRIPGYCEELISGSPAGQGQGSPPGATGDPRRGQGGPPTTGGRGQGQSQPPGRR